MEFADGNFVMLSNTDACSDLINDPDFKAWHQSIDNTPVKKGLPQGMTPDTYLKLAQWARRNANRWRVLLVQQWSDPAAPRWMKQLAANLGESGLAKFKL